MMSRSGGLKPRAVAGRPSVTRLTHNSCTHCQQIAIPKDPTCTGISASGRPRAAVRKMQTTSPMLEEIRYRMNCIGGKQGRTIPLQYLFGVVVDGSAFFDGSDNSGKVIVCQDHSTGALGHGGTRAHGNTNVCLLKSWSIVHSITSLQNGINHNSHHQKF